MRSMETKSEAKSLARLKARGYVVRLASDPKESHCVGYFKHESYPDGIYKVHDEDSNETGKTLKFATKSGSRREIIIELEMPHENLVATACGEA